MDNKPIAYDAYQELADAYAAMIDTKPHNAYYDRPAMLGLLPDVQGRKVLDAGCGPGAYAEQLVDRGATVVGCDISERMLELAANRLSKSIADGRVELMLLDMTQPLTVFPDNEFDVVNAPLCLDYVSDWRSLFKEFYRILKPGGVFLFSCGHPAFDAEYFQSRDYFAVERVECIWKGFGKKVRMPSYRRPLEEIFAPIFYAGLVVDRVHEPLPTDEFKKIDPRRYKLLMDRPGFVCIRTHKP